MCPVNCLNGIPTLENEYDYEELELRLRAGRSGRWRKRISPKKQREEQAKKWNLHEKKQIDVSFPLLLLVNKLHYLIYFKITYL